MNNITKTISVVILSVLTYVIIFLFSGAEKTFYQLTKINIFFYLLSFVCFFLVVFFWGTRWKMFLKFNKYDVPISFLIKNLFVGIAVNNLTPVGKMGGEPIRAYLLKKEYNIPAEKGLATILADMAIEFMVSLTLIITSVVLATFCIELPPWLFYLLVVFIILASIAFGGILGVYSNKNFILNIILRIVKKMKKGKYKKRVVEIYRGFQKTFSRSFKNKKLFLGATSS